MAEASDVPLGSTSYHFEDKGELIGEVVKLARERNRALSTRILREQVAEGGLAVGLAQLIEELTVRQHHVLVIDHDLYLASLRNRALKAESRQWSLGFVEMLEEYTDHVTAEVLGFFFDGVCMQAAVLDIMFFASDVEPHIRRILRE